MSIKIVAALFYFVVVTIQACLDISQPAGKCTACGPLDVLINGICFVKIRGCLRHESGPKCVQCQFGYILNAGICIREAVFLNKTVTSQIPPVRIETQSALTLADIKNKIGEQYGSSFSDAHDYFLNKYINELGKGLIQDVKKLETKKGVFLIIQYLGESKKQYRAVAFVDSSGNVREWSFDLSSVPKKDPLVADLNIRTALGAKLNNYFIYSFRQNGDIYTVDYMSTQLDVIRVIVNKNEIISSSNLLPKLAVTNLGFSNIAFEQVIKLYPEYASSIVASIQKYDKYYVLTLNNAMVSFSFDNFTFKINKPYSISAPAGQNTSQPLPGGFSPFTTYSDPRFSNAIQFIAKQFIQIVLSQVTKVQSQVVEGLIFLINLKKSVPNSTVVDLYQFKVLFNMNSTYQIIQATKNGLPIYNSNYNYNQDPLFFSSYTAASAATNVSNIPPIDTVMFKLVGTRKYLKVSYSPTQFMQFQYFTNNSTTNVLTYVVDGENILKSLLTVKAAAQVRSSEVLLTFLKTNNVSLGPAIVQQVVVNNTLYTLTVVNNDGTYTAIIEDTGVLSLKSLTKISNTACYDMRTQQIQTSLTISTIDTFLRSNYPLTNFNIQLIQVNVTASNIVYRFLYATSTLKQIQIYMLQADSNANVIKAAFINNAFQVVDTSLVGGDYQKIVDYLKSSSLAGSKIPFFTQSNSTIINSYYDDGKSTNQILYDKTTNTAAIQVINTRSYLLVPDGFSLDALVIPGSPSPAELQNIAKLTQEATKKYSLILNGSAPVFANKQNSTGYNFMFKNSFGYQKLGANIDEKGVIFIGRLIVTGYKDADFSNCQKFATDGKCLSCDPNLEVEYQGYCWKKIEGCLVQPGSICVRCNANYTKSGQKCFQQCSNFFS